MGATMERMLERIRQLGPSAADDGYVSFEGAPYHGHRMLVDTVLACTQPGDWILEGGASSGYLSGELTRAGRHVDGIEIDPDAARLAERACDRVIVADLQALDFDELRPTYDVLLFGDTLEHLPDPGALLARLGSKLRPGGHLVVSIPNVANWSMRLALALGRWEYKDRGLLDRTHLRFFTKRTAMRLLEDAGYRVESAVAAVPVPLVRWQPLMALAHRIGNLWPSLFAYTFVIAAGWDGGDRA
jgi:2-polyprenyl-3-methyl-5-hydroxy-6-metoxy-1,4-benzoquinol methylase